MENMFLYILKTVTFASYWISHHSTIY